MKETMARLENLSRTAMLDAIGPLPAGQEQILRRLRVAPRHRWLVRRWLVALTEAGLIEHSGGRYVALRAPEVVRPGGLGAFYADLGFPPAMAEFHTAALANLPHLLRDEISVQQLLFSGRDVITALAAYQDNVFTRDLNARCGRLLLAAAQRRTAPLRVVELGGGAGTTTAAVLDALAGQDVRYLFTDVSRLFTVAAGQRFGVRTASLDIDRDFTAQGVRPGSADVVLAGNVLHNSVHIGHMLARVRDLLSPGGELVFTESTGDNHAVLTSMQFLLSPAVGEPSRGDEVFLDEKSWWTELTTAGFAVMSVAPAPDSPLAAGGQALFHAVRES